MSDQAAIVQAVVDLLKAETSLGLKAVYYGDQGGIPETPSAAVELGDKTRAYTQTGLQTTALIEVHVVIYHGQVTDVQVIKKELDEYAQVVEDLLHEDNTLGGLVISGLVTTVEPGVVVVARSQFYAHRLVWQGLIKERIGV
jgi:hypothetical protein